MQWERNATLDYYSAEVPEGRYYCTRTWLDVTVVRFNGEEIYRSSDGSHDLGLKFAEAHLTKLREK